MFLHVQIDLEDNSCVTVPDDMQFDNDAPQITGAEVLKSDISSPVSLILSFSYAGSMVILLIFACRKS